MKETDKELYTLLHNGIAIIVILRLAQKVKTKQGAVVVLIVW